MTHSRYVKRLLAPVFLKNRKESFFTWRLPPVGGCTLWRRIEKKEEGIDRIMISENLRKYATEKFERRRELLAPVDACYRRKIKTVQ